MDIINLWSNYLLKFRPMQFKRDFHQLRKYIYLVIFWLEVAIWYKFDNTS